MLDPAPNPTLLQTNTPPQPQPRPNVKRHLIAAALSTLVPGLGQLYLRRYKKAALLLVALFVISSGFWFLRLPESYTGVLFLLWMFVPLSGFAILNALIARDLHLSAKMSRWWIFAGIPLSYIGVNLLFTPLLLGSGFHPIKNLSSSMEPTIFVGDKLVTDEHYFRHRSVRRGDLVLMQRNLRGSETPSGRDENLLVIKRVVAIAGDTIEGKDQAIILNGAKQNEPYVQHRFGVGANPQLDTFGPITIPPGKYYVLGDNRDISLDSRTASFGLVDASAIVGKPLYGYRITGHPLSWQLN